MEIIVGTEGPRLRIERADPQVWIADQVLDHLNHPDVDLSDGGTVLTINAINRRVVYRIDTSRTHPQRPSLIYAEWPD